MAKYLNTPFTEGNVENVDASDVSFTPSGTIPSDNVQSAIEDIDAFFSFLNNKVDTDVVHIAGDETITGSKTFTAETIIGNGLGSPLLTLNRDESGDSYIQTKREGVISWKFGDNSTNTLLNLFTYDNSGVSTGTPISIPRDSGGPIVVARTVQITSATSSNATNTGALTVVGGVGIGGSLYTADITAGIGGVSSSTSLTFNRGASGSIAILFKTNNSIRWQLGETSANNNFNLTAYDTNGVAIDNPISIERTNSITLRRQTLVTSTTASTSFTTGALVVSGGLGVAGDVYTNSSLTTLGDIASTSGYFKGTNAIGADTAANNLRIQTGISTGNAVPASIIFSTTTQGTTGSSPQTLSERMRISSSGRVLIGTTSDPGYGLYVGTTTGFNNIVFFSSTANITCNAAATFNTTTTNPFLSFIKDSQAYTLSINTDNQLLLTSNPGVSDNAGIQVLSGTSPTLTVGRDNLINNYHGLLKAGNTNGSNATGNNLLISSGAGTGNGVSGYIDFSTSVPGSSGSTAHTFASRMRLSRLGNLLIGTPTDNGVDKLQVAGSSAFSAVIRTNGTRVSYSSKTANYTLTSTDEFVEGDCTSGNLTFTLPAASAGTQRYGIKKIDSSVNTLTITRAGSDTIDGQTTFVLSNQYDSVLLISNGSNRWSIY